MILKQNMFVQLRIINKIKYLAINQHIFELDEVGELVWDSIDGATSLEAIVHRIADQYKMPSEEIHKDIASFVKDLEKYELVEVERE
ncbi:MULTISPECIES: PqqD family protein [unclassified Paenibacillus]|nr:MULTISPECIES: PqqD family protein [unclassified Paenibacillus]MDF9844153.1 hypothetical protein [Paenibacillus sp. PastF-2]MDH6510024.1 hypothetical protein [Paenibacillus sp. PastM-3]